LYRSCAEQEADEDQAPTLGHDRALSSAGATPTAIDNCQMAERKVKAADRSLTLPQLAGRVVGRHYMVGG
jgi:hypothetical protein